MTETITNEQLEALTKPYPAKPLILGGNASTDHYETTVWERTVEAMIKRRGDAAPALAAALLAERKAREVEVGELKRTMFTVRVIAVDALFQPTFQRTALERISAELRAALEGPTP